MSILERLQHGKSRGLDSAGPAGAGRMSRTKRRAAEHERALLAAQHATSEAHLAAADARLAAADAARAGADVAKSKKATSKKKAKATGSDTTRPVSATKKTGSKAE